VSSPAVVPGVLAGLGALVHELLDDDQLPDDGQLATPSSSSGESSRISNSEVITVSA
jgi:hypothetical protein